MTRRWRYVARWQVAAGAIVTLLLALVVTPPLAVHANQLPYYYLPWAAGKSHTVSQGNQSGDHVGLYAYALDFAGDGWNVFSARAGNVSWLQDGYGPGGCDQLKYQNLVNYVVIRSTESDGSQHEAQYLHLARGSASIRVGLH
jgi:hypothetical protein